MRAAESLLRIGAKPLWAQWLSGLLDDRLWRRSTSHMQHTSCRLRVERRHVLVDAEAPSEKLLYEMLVTTAA